MLTIPLAATPSQTLSVQLGGQSCRIDVYQKTTGLYVDLYVQDSLIIGGVLALNNTKIVRSVYLGFVGDLFFWDTQGTSDPTYDGLGSRYIFIYWEAADGA